MATIKKIPQVHLIPNQYFLSEWTLGRTIIDQDELRIHTILADETPQTSSDVLLGVVERNDDADIHHADTSPCFGRMMAYIMDIISYYSQPLLDGSRVRVLLRSVGSFPAVFVFLIETINNC